MESELQQAPRSESGSESDDGGYVTPGEVSFADDERPPTPKKNVAPQTGDCEDPVCVPPELQQQIVEQVEWYFSDENLSKDSFLVKHIHRNKQGLVSLKLVASFRKSSTATAKKCAEWLLYRSWISHTLSALSLCTTTQIPSLRLRILRVHSASLER
jgi:hypothetical protein